MAPLDTKLGKKIRGVNLGGWLVLERWMTPSLFGGLEARDETTWCLELGFAAKGRLIQHWETFITEKDFRWLRQVGINAVRIPVGFWIFGPPYPYHPKYLGKTHPFVEGGVAYLDRAFDWADKYGIGILLDLHAAPGCQNGFDNGGLHGICDWHRKEKYINFALDILQRLAHRYGRHTSLIGLEVLNEPHWDIPTDILKDYTRKAYSMIRNHCDKQAVAVVFHDGFRPHTEYQGDFQEPRYTNVMFDIHRYQCFDRSDIDMDIYGHIQKAAIHWKKEADDINRQLKLGTYVGEWSLGLDLKVVSLWAEGPFNHALEHMDEFQQDVAYRAYGAAQLATFETYSGWFFWSYKTETTPAWCFRDCVRKGWLPDKYE
jgi:glucan 1,3-beta-glucosidase